MSSNVKFVYDLEVTRKGQSRSKVKTGPSIPPRQVDAFPPPGSMPKWGSGGGKFLKIDAHFGGFWGILALWTDSVD